MAIFQLSVDEKLNCSSSYSSPSEKYYKCKLWCRKSGFVLYDTKGPVTVTVKSIPEFAYNQMTQKCEEIFGGSWYSDKKECEEM